LWTKLLFSSGNKNVYDERPSCKITVLIDYCWLCGFTIYL